MATPETSSAGQAPSDARAQPVGTPLPAGAPEPPPPVAPSSSARRWLIRAVGAIALLLALFEGVPWFLNALRTVSTDDAYVNGHVTFVAARVPGQVTKVLVDRSEEHTSEL